MTGAQKWWYAMGATLALILTAAAGAVDKPTSTQKTCVTAECHASYAKKAFVHGPVSLGDCKSCHEEVDAKAHTYKLSREGRDLCEYCHLDQTTKKNIHEPLKTGKCTDCHDPHSSDNKALVRGKTVAELCAKCHQTVADVQFPHGPVAVGECTVCHASHSADRPKLLVDEPTNLCFSCHVVTKNELSQFEFVHEPAKNDCIGCHNPHGAANPKMLKADAPDVCYPCHKDIQKVAQTSKHKHTAVTEQGGCLHCHTPHASTVQFILKDAPMSLCETCHNEPVKTEDGKPVPSFTAQIKDKKFLHGPVAQKDCTGCHATHGSEHFRLLAKDYPQAFYALQHGQICFVLQLSPGEPGVDGANLRADGLPQRGHESALRTREQATGPDLPVVPRDACERPAQAHPGKRSLRRVESADPIPKDGHRRRLPARLSSTVQLRSQNARHVPGYDGRASVKRLPGQKGSLLC
jgi:predicted CXXCH cytochrome family protein